MNLYLRLLGASLRARMQYKWDFIATSLMYAMITAIDFLTVAAILYRFGTVGGWSVYEVALLSGIISTSYGIYRTLASELNTFEKYMVTGEFDMIMIRPWPTLATVITRNVDFGRIGAALQGVLLIVVGLSGVLAEGAPAWLVWYSAILPLAGAVVITAISLATAACGFWLIRIDELSIFTLNAPNAAGNYPVHIFPGWMRRLLLYVVPTGTIGYVPLTYALGKTGSLWNLMAPFPAALLSFTVAYGLWRLGERHYQSTGN